MFITRKNYSVSGGLVTTAACMFLKPVWYSKRHAFVLLLLFMVELRVQKGEAEAGHTCIQIVEWVNVTGPSVAGNDSFFARIYPTFKSILSEVNLFSAPPP